MKKFWLLIIVLLSSLDARSNEPDSTNRKWELGVFYLPSTIDESFDLLSRETYYLLGFSTQANIYINEKVSLEAGFNYKYKRIEDVRKIGSSNIAGDFNSIDIDKTNILEIPIKFKFYSIVRHKMSFYFISGITNSFYSSEAIHMYIDYLGSNSSILNWKYYNLIVNLGIGGQYYLNEKIGILFEPSIGYFAVGGLQQCIVLELKTGVAYRF